MPAAEEKIHGLRVRVESIEAGAPDDYRSQGPRRRRLTLERTARWARPRLYVPLLASQLIYWALAALYVSLTHGWFGPDHEVMTGLLFLSYFLLPFAAVRLALHVLRGGLASRRSLEARRRVVVEGEMDGVRLRLPLRSRVHAHRLFRVEDAEGHTVLDGLDAVESAAAERALREHLERT